MAVLSTNQLILSIHPMNKFAGYPMINLMAAGQFTEIFKKENGGDEIVRICIHKFDIEATIV